MGAFSDKRVRRAAEHLRRGETALAAKLYRKYLSEHPSDAKAWHALAGCCFATRDVAGAIGAMRAALRVAPDNAAYHSDLGALHLQEADLANAERHFRRALALEPASRGAAYNLAHCLYAAGRIAEAVECLQALIARAPDFAEAHFNLGVALRAAGQARAAAAAFTRVIALEPEHAEARLELARVHQAGGRPDLALDHYARVVASDAADVTARCAYAVCAFESGAGRAALAPLEAELKRAAPPVQVLLAAGRILLDLGDLDAARAMFDAVLVREPVHVGAALRLVELREVTQDDPLIARLERAATEARSEPELASILFGLGKAYDDLGDYARAFAQYTRANTLRAHRTRYDCASRERLTDALIEYFDADRICALQRFAESSDLPVFVVGMPRSGTTLVETLIAAHPAAHGAGELRYFSALPQVIAERLDKPVDYPACLDALDADLGTEITATYLGLLRRHASEATRVVDKLPGNFLHLGLIMSLFPNCRVIDCRRTPADVCLSIHFQDFQDPPAYASRLADIAHFYGEYTRLMGHWRARFPGRILRVDYGAVVCDFEREARRVLAHCGLDWHPACADFHHAAREVRTASRAQVRRPLYRTSLERWRHYADFLPPEVLSLNAAYGATVAG